MYFCIHFHFVEKKGAPASSFKSYLASISRTSNKFRNLSERDTYKHESTEETENGRESRSLPPLRNSIIAEVDESEERKFSKV
jgi:hypothetical protein